MPGIDTVSIEEKIDFLRGWQQAIDDTEHPRIDLRAWDTNVSFQRQERAIASSEGTFVTQTTYHTEGDFEALAQPRDWRKQQQCMVSATGLEAQGKGWDTCLDAKLTDQIPALYADAELLGLPLVFNTILVDRNGNVQWIGDWETASDKRIIEAAIDRANHGIPVSR